MPRGERPPALTQADGGERHQRALPELRHRRLLHGGSPPPALRQRGEALASTPARRPPQPGQPAAGQPPPAAAPWPGPRSPLRGRWRKTERSAAAPPPPPHVTAPPRGCGARAGGRRERRPAPRTPGGRRQAERGPRRKGRRGPGPPARRRAGGFLSGAARSAARPSRTPGPAAPLRRAGCEEPTGRGGRPRPAPPCPPTPPAGGSCPAVPGRPPPEDGAGGCSRGVRERCRICLCRSSPEGNGVGFLNGAGGRQRPCPGNSPGVSVPVLAAPRGGTAASPSHSAGCSRRGTAKRCAVPRDKATAEVYTEQQ